VIGATIVSNGLSIRPFWTDTEVEMAILSNSADARYGPLQRAFIKLGFLGERSFVPRAERWTFMLVMAIMVTGIAVLGFDYSLEFSRPRTGQGADNIALFLIGILLFLVPLRFSPLRRWVGRLDKSRQGGYYIVFGLGFGSIWLGGPPLLFPALLFGFVALQLFELYRMPAPLEPASTTHGSTSPTSLMM
jgi:hypothetical protein